MNAAPVQQDAPEFASSGDYVPCSIRFSQDDYETGVGAFFAYSALDTANEYIVFDEENLVFKAQSEKVNNTYRYNELCKHENMYHSEAMDATCTEQGMKEFWYCEDCYCYFADEDGLASYGEVGDMESYFLEKATGHKFGEDDVCEYCGMKRHVYTQVSTLEEFDALSEDAKVYYVGNKRNMEFELATKKGYKFKDIITYFYGNFDIINN